MSVFRVGSNKSSVNNFPSVRPTLDLDFANSKTLDPRITFTRASGGSYVGADGYIKFTGVNEARFDHDPYTGESLGLLVEEARTNLLLRSEEFNNAYWNKVRSSVTANVTTAPNGTSTADKLTENTDTNSHYIMRDFSQSGAVTYTATVFAKTDGPRWFRLVGSETAGANGRIVNFDLISGVVGNISNATGTITSIGDGWYRCSSTFTSSSDANYRFSMWLLNDSQGASYTGDGVSGIYIWGAQLEEGSFPTSYIPTQAATRTRAADNARITGKNFSEWYRQDEGTIYCRYNRIGIQAASTRFPAPWGVSGGTSFNSMSLVGGFAAPNSRRFDILYFGSATAQLNFSSQFAETANTFYKSAVCYKLNDIAGTVNANSVLTDTSSNIATVNVLCIGKRDPVSLGDYLNGSISRLTYYPKRLPNAQLQALTK